MSNTTLARKILIPILLATLAGGCTKFDILNATVPPFGYTRTTGLPYADGPRHALDVYVPSRCKAKTPVVIFFYGGDWQMGNKRDYRFVGKALASEGFIAVLPDYRLYPPTIFPGFVDDGARAVRWVRDHIAEFNGDPDRIHLMGHSAGAHIAALLALDARYLRAVGLDRSSIRSAAVLAGPYDFTPGGSDRGVFGMKPGDMPDLDIEPMHFADGPGNPPMLIVQGLADDIVSPQKAAEFAAALRVAGGEARFIGYPRVGHAQLVVSLAWPFHWLAPALRDTTAYFRE